MTLPCCRSLRTRPARYVETFDSDSRPACQRFYTTHRQLISTFAAAVSFSNQLRRHLDSLDLVTFLLYSHLHLAALPPNRAIVDQR